MLTVCIVDDSADIRDIYSLKFQREGFMVVVARDGAEGLQLIREKRPDVILLDIEMPVMGGLEVLKALKEDPELEKIPVVVMSNIDNEAMFQRVSELGAAKYYLVKSLTDSQRVVSVTLEALNA